MIDILVSFINLHIHKVDSHGLSFCRIFHCNAKERHINLLHSCRAPVFLEVIVKKKLQIKVSQTVSVLKGKPLYAVCEVLSVSLVDYASSLFYD